MSVSDADLDVIKAMFQAMQAGADGEEAMMALFANDAVVIEPFSGEPRTHEGIEAVRANFKEQWAMPLPAMTITLDRVDLDQDQIKADWTCNSPVFPSPMKGHDLFVIRDGKIANLEVVVTDMPPMDMEH